MHQIQSICLELRLLGQSSDHCQNLLSLGEFLFGTFMQSSVPAPLIRTTIFHCAKISSLNHLFLCGVYRISIDRLIEYAMGEGVGVNGLEISMCRPEVNFLHCISDAFHLDF